MTLDTERPRALSGARAALVGYLAALMINLGLILGQPRPTVVSSPPPIVFTRSRLLVDERWDPREIVHRSGRQVVIVDLTPDLDPALPSVISPN